VRRSWILHPFLIALYPAASLLARNLGQLPASEAARAALVCLTLSAIVLLIARVALRDWHAAAVLASLSLLLFFSDGHLYSEIEGR